MTTLKAKLNKIDKHYRKAGEIAIAEVETLAREVLKKCPCFTEFIMGMGTAFFLLDEKLDCDQIWGLGFKAAGILNPDVDTCAVQMNEPPKELVMLNGIINEWDEYLKLTGNPMRFTTNGPKITNW